MDDEGEGSPIQIGVNWSKQAAYLGSRKIERSAEAFQVEIHLYLNNELDRNLNYP